MALSFPLGTRKVAKVKYTRPASIFPPNIPKDDDNDDDDRRKKMFLVKKRADMHGNCMRGRKEATRERIKRVEVRARVRGEGGRNPDSYKKREREREGPVKEGENSPLSSRSFAVAETICMLAR